MSKDARANTHDLIDQVPDEGLKEVLKSLNEIIESYAKLNIEGHAAPDLEVEITVIAATMGDTYERPPFFIDPTEH